MLKRAYSVYERFSPSYYRLLKKELKGCKTVLEFGCGYDSPLRLLKGFHSVGIDIHAPTIERARALKTHDEYIIADVLKYRSRKKFDCAVALDVIEHVKKKDGRRLMENMEKSARKVIIFTPNGYVPQAEEYVKENPFQAHLSGWTVIEFKKKGYQVRGINGLKWLRKENAKVRGRPKLLWIALAEITQWITARVPRLAFQLLAVKETDGKLS